MIPSTDETLLEMAFDDALSWLQQGRTPSADELLPDRPDLHDRVQEGIRLASEVIPASPIDAPRFGSYTILGELGRGGSGEVFLARQQCLGGRVVALKVLRAGASLSPHARRRFEFEARTIAGLSHPNIVPVYDLVQEDGAWAFAMEWVDGLSLATFIERVGETMTADDRHAAAAQALPECAMLQRGASLPRFIAGVGLRIAGALDAVHRAGLVHRDVKPSNILLRRDGTPLLADFGLVRDHTPDRDGGTFTVTGLFVGTPGYAAPEQFQTGRVTHAADVFALGASMYHALACVAPRGPGWTPEENSTVPLARVARAVPKDLCTIIDHAMHTDPRRRYASAEDFAADLLRFLDDRPVMARRPSLPRRWFMLAKRNRRALAGVVAGGTGALVIVTLVALYTLVFPSISARIEREARAETLRYRMSHEIWNEYFFGRRATDRSDFSPAQADLYPLAAIEDAITLHEALTKAARLQPWNQRLARNRNIAAAGVELLRTYLLVDPPPPDSGPGRSLPPSLKAYFDARLAARRPIDATALIANATDDERRAFGLLAAISDDVRAAELAWSQTDLTSRPDPLIDAWMGLRFLVDDQPARAYPRLRVAVDSLPEISWIRIPAAEAAARCGDLDVARSWLRGIPTHWSEASLSGFRRVNAVLLAKSGRYDEALDLFERAMPEDHTIVFARDWVATAVEAGRTDIAALETLRVITSFPFYDLPGNARVLDLFARALGLWWQSLSNDQRAVWIINTAEERTGVLAFPPFEPTPQGFVIPVSEGIGELRDAIIHRGVTPHPEFLTLIQDLDRAGLFDPLFRDMLRQLGPDAAAQAILARLAATDAQESR